MNLDNFDYVLPKENIAQEPTDIRTDSRLLVLSKKDNSKKEDYFYNLLNHLSPNDLIIFNNTRVIPARIYGLKETGARVEVLFEKKISNNIFLALVKCNSQIKIDEKIIINDVHLSVKKKDNNLYTLEVLGSNVETLFISFGQVPLPPYIHRKPSKEDTTRYQTVFSSINGSSAAPTAGLHFDENLIKKMKSYGLKYVFCTLHIGLGTFNPIRCSNINDHKLHEELFNIPRKTIEEIESCRNRGGKVIAVGTTVLRALESFFSQGNYSTDQFYSTDIYIKPGYNFKVVDGLITNFHLPKSSLLILIAAFYGLDKTIEAYNFAVKNNYRFFSYGDANLII